MGPGEVVHRSGDWNRRAHAGRGVRGVQFATSLDPRDRRAAGRPREGVHTVGQLTVVGRLAADHSELLTALIGEQCSVGRPRRAARRSVFDSSWLRCVPRRDEQAASVYPCNPVHDAARQGCTGCRRPHVLSRGLVVRAEYRDADHQRDDRCHRERDGDAAEVSPTLRAHGHDRSFADWLSLVIPSPNREDHARSTRRTL
jgi:hypothetical protein